MQKIGEFVLVTSFYGSVVGIFIILTRIIFKKRLSPKWNYLIWLILIVKLLIPFGPESYISIFNKLELNNRKADYYNIYSNNNFNDNEVINNVDNVKNNLNYNQRDNIDSNKYNHNYKNNKREKGLKINYIYIIWAVVAINIFLFIVITYLMLNIRLRKRSTNPSTNIISILEKSKKKINVKRKIDLIVNEYVTTPALTGILRPKILLPINMINLDEKELEYIFLHELAHYKRKDTIINYILIFLQSIHWFNPIIWYCFKKIKGDMEFATDEKVLNILEDKEHKAYGLAILSVIEKMNNSIFYPRLVSMATDRKKIEKRIRKIKDIKFIKSKSMIFTGTGLILIISISLLGLTSAVDDESKFTRLQKSYIDVVTRVMNGEDLSKNQIMDIVSYIKPVEIDRPIKEVSGEFYNSELESINFISGKETLSVSYNKKNYDTNNLNSIHYVNEETTGYSNGIYLSYSPIMTDKFSIKIGVNSVINQENAVNDAIRNKSYNKLYEKYYKVASYMESKSIIYTNDVKRIINNIESSSGYMTIQDKDITLNVFYDEKTNVIKYIMLTDGKQMIMINSNLISRDNLNKSKGIVSKHLDTIDDQISILNNVTNNKIKSDLSNVNEKIDSKEIEDLRKKNIKIGMNKIEEVSYGSEDSPHLKTMEDTMKYIRKYTNENIKEVDRRYFEDVGSSEILYKYKNNSYIVWLNHPYKEYGNEYDLNNTVGITIYESILNNN